MDRLCMTVQELAHQLGISRPKAYELTKIEGFPVLHVGRRIVIPMDAFVAWMNENSRSGGAK